MFLDFHYVKNSFVARHLRRNQANFQRNQPKNKGAELLKLYNQLELLPLHICYSSMFHMDIHENDSFLYLFQCFLVPIDRSRLMF